MQPYKEMKESLGSVPPKVKLSPLKNKQLSGDEWWLSINHENIHSNQDADACNYSVRPN